MTQCRHVLCKNISKRKRIRFFVAFFSIFIGIAFVFKMPARKAAATAETKVLIQSLYRNILDRDPDDSGLDFWINALKDEAYTGTKLVEFFFHSKELEEKNLTDDQYVEILYHTIFLRNPDLQGKLFWETYLEKGVSRNAILRQFLLTQEFADFCILYGVDKGFPELREPRDENLDLTVFLCRQYEVILGRDADDLGLNYWATMVLHEGIPIEKISESFVFSTEFENGRKNRTTFIDTLYRTFLGRESDEDGRDFWLQSLQLGGVTRKELFYEFVYSPEFQNIVQGFGLQTSPREYHVYDKGTDFEIEVASCIIKLVNEYRLENGIKAISVSDALCEGTSIRVRESVRSFSHTRPDGTRFSSVAYQVGYDWSYISENLAMTGLAQSSSRTPEALAQKLFDLWKGSSDHNKNMLEPSHINIGVSVYYDGESVYGAQLFGIPV